MECETEKHQETHMPSRNSEGGHLGGFSSNPVAHSQNLFGGWPARHPLVAPEHRQEVLKSIGATERVLPFVEVRTKPLVLGLDMFQKVKWRGK